MPVPTPTESAVPTARGGPSRTRARRLRRRASSSLPRRGNPLDQPRCDDLTNSPLNPADECFSLASPLFWKEARYNPDSKKTDIFIHHVARWQPTLPLHGLCRELGNGEEPTRLNQELFQLRQALVQLFPGVEGVAHNLRSGCQGCNALADRLSNCYELLSQVGVQLVMAFPKLGWPQPAILVPYVDPMALGPYTEPRQPPPPGTVSINDELQQISLPPPPIEMDHPASGSPDEDSAERGKDTPVDTTPNPTNDDTTSTDITNDDTSSLSDENQDSDESVVDEENKENQAPNDTCGPDSAH